MCFYMLFIYFSIIKYIYMYTLYPYILLNVDTLYSSYILYIYGGGQKMGSTKTRHLAIREKIMTNS